MTTKLLYLDETNMFEASAVTQSFGRSEKGPFVVFDQTNFYPQGGGQPADSGIIIQGDDVIPITFVGFEMGDVRHFFQNPLLRE